MAESSECAQLSFEHCKRSVGRESLDDQKGLVSVCMYVCTYVCMNECISIYMYICMCVFIYVNMCVCMYLCMYICV